MNQLLIEKIGFTYHQVLVAIICLYMLYYTWNKHLNILQKVNGQFIFTNNILKRVFEAFYQKNIIILDKSFSHNLIINAKVMIDTIVEKHGVINFYII